ncbi:lipid droplet-regulating VLDL assembly factor AUP1-like isoform X1 [Dreissena polymorpha]|uniref:lipid droplet-regulating VLDL assembly factor AUP1-like isoform X1 n=2 Tax=Dreissena polymorpha TaxID=45954 RepID=UPI002264F575|nr:lipid droplet-regulating VLDL assembly factor AUP1-like isoform X1 [Dreissena polymorpha]
MVEISALVTESRFPPGFKYALMVLYFPIGVFLIVCRVLIALHTYMVVCLMPRAAARRQFVRGMFGVLGVHIWVEEDPSTISDTPRVLVSNNTSVLDHCVIDVVISHFVPYHSNVPKPLQWVLGYKDLVTGVCKENIPRDLRNFIQEHKIPLLIQPEGATTNGSGLLKFNPLAFELQLAVQPVSIHLSRLSFPCALSTMDSPRWTDVLWCFFAPVTVYKLKTHPLMVKNEEESVEDFAERVREVISTALTIERTDLTAADLAEHVKRLKSSPQTITRTKPMPSQPAGNYGNSGSCVDSLDSELRRMIQQVKDVLPQVPVIAVKKDLEITKDVDATITNILEGRVEYCEEEVKPVTSASSPTCVLDKDSTLFRASSFSRNPNDRHLSLEDRKRLMLETARLRYKEKHNVPFN